MGRADLFGDAVEDSRRHARVPRCLLPAVVDVHHLGDAQLSRLCVHVSGVAALTHAVNAHLPTRAKV